MLSSFCWIAAVLIALGIFSSAACAAEGTMEPWAGGKEISREWLRAHLKGLKHPYLFFSEKDLPGLKARNLRMGNDAQGLAMKYLLTGDKDAAQACKAKLLGLKVAPVGDRQWYESMTESWEFAIAYDWIAASGVFSADEEKQFRERLAANIDSWVNFLRKNGRGVLVLDNCTYRLCSGFGIAALALADYSGPNVDAIEWTHFYLNELFGKGAGTDQDGVPYGKPNQLEIYIMPDGFYLEGAAYYNYAWSMMQSLLLACTHLFNADFFQYRDADGTPLIRNLYRHQLEQIMPSRMSPQVGDSENFYVKWMSEVAAAYARSDPATAAAALWYVNDTHSGDSKYYIAELLKLRAGDAFGRIQPQPTGWSRQPTVFSMRGSYVAFRSDWTRDATYLLLLGRTDRCNSSHLHADQLSFQMYARRAYMLLDAGYVKNRGAADNPNSRAFCRSMKGHNAVVIDDKSFPYPDDLPTPGAPTANRLRVKYAPEMKDCLGTECLDAAEVSSTFEQLGVTSRRTVLFPGKSYFIVWDALLSDKEHQYDSYLHFGQEAGSGSLVRDGQKFVCKMKNDDKEEVELSVCFAAPQGLEFLQETGAAQIYDVPSKDFREIKHPIVKARTKAANADYLMVLYPRKLSEPEAKIEPLSEGGVRGAKITTSGGTDYAMLSRGVVPLAGSAGELIFASVKGGALDYFMVKNGTAFVFNGKTVWSSPVKKTVALRARNGCIEVAVREKNDAPTSPPLQTTRTQPPAPHNTPAAESVPAAVVPPEKLAPWKTKLRARVAELLRTGKQPAIFMKRMGAANIAAANAETLVIVFGAGKLEFKWAQFGDEDWMGLAEGCGAEGDAQGRIFWGVFLLARGSTEQAEEQFTKALLADPSAIETVRNARESLR
jgi:hypothetical protein